MNLTKGSPSFFEPLVSIVIPVYNGSNYIREAIDSALSQTYKNIEIIVVNDGSTDNLEEVVSFYGKKIRFFSKENGGVASALNLGIKNMKGDYFSWLSHDDVYLPYKIERQINELSLLDDKDTMLFSNWMSVDAQCREITRTFFDGYGDAKLSNPLFCVLFGLIHGCTILVSKRNFNLCGVFDETRKTSQDYDFWVRMSSKNSIKFVSDYLVKVRMHAEQKTRIDINANVESNIFWINAIQQLSSEDMLSMERSKLIFFVKMRRFLKRARYYHALKVVREIMEQHFGKWIIFVIILDDLRTWSYKILFRPFLKLIFGRDFVKR
ncbi:MAG: glycosyltransferase, partial [Holosporaceae bacterium]|nr:glycosyltransferase [Holosporaceae bacterium]